MKKGHVILILSFLLVIFLAGAYSYSKYSTEVSGDAHVDIAKWNITVNGCPVEGTSTNTNCGKEITSADGSTYTVDFAITGSDITYDNSNSNVAPGKISPGSDGSFKIRIKPNDTDVSFSYSIVFGDMDTTADITISYNNTEIETDDAITGTINLNDFSGNSSYEVDLDIDVTWNYHDDDENNKKDTELGMSGDNPILYIPVTVTFTQIK